MIPGNQLSVTPVIAPYSEQVNDPDAPLVDYELGGTALSDPSDGLQVKTWTAFMDGNDVRIQAEDVAATTLLTLAGVTEISLAFDQEMRPAIAYVQNGVAKLWWYDPAVVGYDTITFGADMLTPRLTLDEKRPVLIDDSDIILAYIKDNNLYFRAQRDSFLVEYLLREEINASLVSIAMSDNFRLKFKLRMTNG
jgi:hypothetical protein